ncbi:hypothetical protein BaRGS_00035638, partial [Batillaria attramentaria]
VRLDAVEGNRMWPLYCGVTVGDPATLTLPSDPAGWTQAVVIGYKVVWQYGPKVRLDAVEGNTKGCTLLCGVTVGDPATLTLPLFPAEWTQAVVIGYGVVWQYGPK